MQVFRLVEGGRVDKMIAFDKLPESLLKGVRHRDLAGLGRHWKDFAEIDRDGVHYHYFLEYKDVNSDKEKWEAIEQYVRRSVSIDFRLRDRLSDMAKDLAPTPYVNPELEPENIPVIPILATGVEASPEIITEAEILKARSEAAESSKRGRPRKVLQEA